MERERESCAMVQVLSFEGKGSFSWDIRLIASVSVARRLKVTYQGCCNLYLDLLCVDAICSSKQLQLYNLVTLCLEGNAKLLQREKALGGFVCSECDTNDGSPVVTK